ncbi:MAG: 4Fe-4S binding protein [Candidatus Hydrogenedens sp.]|nr:4Fe-4S binding protein [Candidatus Hydrogenedens sp.]
MRRYYSTLLVSLLVLIPAVHAQDGAFRFPMPEFESGYHHPEQVFPGADLTNPRVDVLVLAVVLALSAWFVLRRRNRRELLALTVFSLVYFGFWRQGCVCSVGSLQNIAASLVDPTFPVPWVVLLFFLLPLIAALFFGRVFCAAACPLGAIQELFTLWPLQLPRPLDRVLRLFPYLYLGLALLSVFLDSGFLICAYDPFIGFFRQGGSFNMLLAGALLLTAGIFIGRPYCRYLCPYGVLLSWMSTFSKWHLRIPEKACIQCKLCEEACPYGAIDFPVTEAAPLTRHAGARQLMLFTVLTPLVILLCAWIGMMSHVYLARIHSDIRLTERILAEERGEVEGMTIESEAFRSGNTTIPALLESAGKIQEQYKRGSAWLGAFMGLVIMVMIIRLSLVRHRVDYEANKTHCVSCARCFAYCPVEEEAGCVTQ